MQLRKNISYNSRLAILLFAAFLSLLPIVFIFLNSFMGTMEAEARYTSAVTYYNIFGVVDNNLHYIDMTLLPDVLSLTAYRDILLRDPTHLRFLWNSLILAIPIVLGQLIISPLGAYGFERAKAKHKEKLFFAYILTMLLPMQALLVPHFIIANFFGFDGNYLAIILPAIFGPFGVFLIRQQMKGFEKSIIEAASVDGAGELTIFYKIVLPNLKPAITALLVLTFADAWNIVDQAVVFIREPALMPMSVHLSRVCRQ